MKAKRYWIITSEYPPSYGGGIGTYCYHNARMLAQYDWEVTVFVPAASKKEAGITDEGGIRVVKFTHDLDAMTYLGFETNLSYRFAEVLKQYMQQEGIPAILESQEYAGIAYFTLLYKHLCYDLFRDLKVLLTLHAPAFLYFDYNRVPSYQLPYFWVGEMEKWCIKAADLLNAPGQFLPAAIMPYFQPALDKEIHVLPYPFEHKNKAVLNGDPRQNWFFFGKMTPQKGIIPLLQSYRRLWQDGWEKELKVIGGGDHYYHPEHMSMEQWIKKHYSTEIQNGKLRLMGRLAPGNWQKETAGGCVVIIPSIGDNYPFTVMESMSNGQVVLASVQGGQRELIRDGENGFLFDHLIPGHLEEKIREIDSASSERLAEIRQSAIRSVAEKHSYNKVYPLKEKIIMQLYNQPVSPGDFPFTRQLELKKTSNHQPIWQKDMLSVIIPYYNMGKYIDETLDTVYRSDYPHIEVIVVDDGSDDTFSSENLKRLQQKYPFQLIRQNNCGLSATRNKGAAMAKGEFVAFMDADDKIDPSFYKKAIAILKEKQNVHFVGSWVQYFENSHAIWPSFTPEFPYLLYYNMVCSGGLLCRRDSFIAAGMNDSALEYGLEDWDAVISMSSNGMHGVVLPETLYQYRIRKGSMARSLTEEKILYSMRYISQKHRKIYASYAVELAALLNANGPGYKIDNPTLDYKGYGALPAWFPFRRGIVSLIKKSPIVKKAAFRIYAAIKR